MSARRPLALAATGLALALTLAACGSPATTHVVTDNSGSTGRRGPRRRPTPTSPSPS